MPEGVISLNIRISPSELEGYASVPAPIDGQPYTIKQLKDSLQEGGVIHGIQDNVLAEIIQGQFYGREFLVARGTAPVDGIDGYYEYLFQVSHDDKPLIREDGTVDYWSVNSVQEVKQGQKIAIYHPPIQGTDGLGVNGVPVLAKRGKEQPLLKGKGFSRSEDDVTYVADIDGKIEMQNDRVMVLSIHEIHKDVDLTFGNIDFRGDVVVHGNVESGIAIKATGSITVDGTVEACSLDAGKDIILRGGMVGGGKGTVKSKGTVYARFFENTMIEAEGNVEADSILNCKVYAKGKVVLAGRRASILGGEIHAIQGVDTYSIGNDAETRTLISVGADPDLNKKVKLLEKKVETTKLELAKIEQGLEQFKLLEQAHGVSFASDPRRMALLRVRIRDTATIAADEAELQKLRTLLDNAKGASVKVIEKIYPGVLIEIDGNKLEIKNMASNVEFYRLEIYIRTKPAR